MSHSIGLTETRAAWHQILSDLQDDLEAVHPLSETIPNETDFRDKFVALSKELHGRDPDHNYAFFIRYHEQILTFIEEIDTAVQLETPRSLSDLFWTAAYVAVKTAFDQEFDYGDFQEIYEDLNLGLPTGLEGLSQFPWNVSVQEPLQKIFQAYIKCYIELIAQVKTDAEEINFEPIENQIEQADTLYKQQEVEWKFRCETALEEARHALDSQAGGAENPDARFEHLRDLGKGSYGAVDEVREASTGSIYARKSIPISALGQEPDSIKERVRNEVNIMSRLRHNHIASVNMFFKNEFYWSIIMLPVADYDLRAFLDVRCVRANYPHEVLRLIDPWFGCLISALTYAHDEQVKHEDIKPSNILIRGRKVYLTDFGTAKDFSELEASTIGGYLEQGTPVYWAPEPRAWGRPADVFALGCVFAEMLTVRQHKSLQEFRKFRFNPSREFGYAYRSNLVKVKRWLKDFLGINNRDPVGQTILEQTLNMLIEQHSERPDARRIKKNLRAEDQLFCASCF